jgi:hypothetical protein
MMVMAEVEGVDDGMDGDLAQLARRIDVDGILAEVTGEDVLDGLAATERGLGLGAGLCDAGVG